MCLCMCQVWRVGRCHGYVSRIVDKLNTWSGNCNHTDTQLYTRHQLLCHMSDVYFKNKSDCFSFSNPIRLDINSTLFVFLSVALRRFGTENWSVFTHSLLFFFYYYHFILNQFKITKCRLKIINNFVTTKTSSVEMIHSHKRGAGFKNVSLYAAYNWKTFLATVTFWELLLYQLKLLYVSFYILFIFFICFRFDTVETESLVNLLIRLNQILLFICKLYRLPPASSWSSMQHPHKSVFISALDEKNKMVWTWNGFWEALSWCQF